MPQPKWPEGKKCAIAFTFDFDAESLVLAQDAATIHRPGALSAGTFGAKVGIHKILEEMASAGVKGTFFTPGWVAANRTAAVEAVARAGHEIGHHSYAHRILDPADPAAEEDDTDRTIEAIKKAVGVAPTGYRAPFGEPSINIIRLLTARGFLYDSSLQDDIVPYRLKVPGAGEAMIELPWHRSTADAPYIVPPRPSFTNDHILTIWKAEFTEAYKAGGYVNMLMHPEAVGRPSRILLLREFLEFVQGHDDVWIATCGEIARHSLATLPPAGDSYTPFLAVDSDGTIRQL